MLKHKTLALLLFSAVSASIPKASSQSCPAFKPCPYSNMKEAISYILSKESAKQWKNIHWRTDSLEALRDARAQQKPIFVFFVVKQKAASPKGWVGDKKNDMGET